MIKPHDFNEDDHKKLVEYLNMVYKKAKFKFNSEEALKYCKLLAHMQQNIVPKVQGHLIEIKKVEKVSETQQEEEKTTNRKKPADKKNKE